MGFALEPIQSNYTAGELDPQLTAREDADLYYTGAQRARNVLLVPHGGFTRRPGLLYRDELLPVLSKVDLTGVTLTAPNGGTAANAVDGDPSTKLVTTTNLGVLDPYVVLHVDLGGSWNTVVRFADVRNISLDGAPFLTINNEFRIQYSTDNAVWNEVEAVFPFVTDEDDRWNYRRQMPSAQVARYWRVVRIGTTDGGTRKVELGEFELYTDTGTLSESKLIEFEFSKEQTYALLATDRNIRVYKDGVRQADVSIPHTSAKLSEMTWTQSLDSLLLFHEDHQIHLVKRLGSDKEWRDQVQPVSDIPTFDFQDSGAGAEPVWSSSRGWPRNGIFFKGRLYVGGTRDRGQTVWASTIADVFSFKQGTAADDAFEYTMDTDETAVIYGFVSADFLFVITSSGPFFQLPRDDPPTGDTVSINRIRGKKRAKGPGLRAFQLDTGVVYLDDSGEQVNEIREEVFRGRFEVNNLAFLAPHLVRNPTDVTLRKALSTDRGDLLLLVNEDGSLGVMQTLRNRDFTGWTGWHTGATAGNGLQGTFKTVGTQVGSVEGRYFAVVERVVQGVTRRYFEEFLDNVFMDSAVVRVAQEEFSTATQGQSVYSYTFTTSANLLTIRFDLVAVDPDDYTIDFGAKTITLSAEVAAQVQGGEQVRIAENIDTVSGLSHVEGETLRTRVNGAVGSDVTVVGGSVTITELCDAECQVGLNFPDCKEIVVKELQTRRTDPLTEEEARHEVFEISDGKGSGDGVWMLDMPLAVPPGGQVPTVRGRKKRVHTAVVTVSNTQGLYFGANGQEPRPLTFQRFGKFLLDRRPPLRSESVRVFNLQGWSLDGRTEVTQRDPIPMTVTSIVRRAIVAG